MSIIKIAVGSTNPVKVTAVQTIVTQIWPDVEIIPLNAPSGVAEMPMSDSECIAGARNRAQAARELAEADMGIGLEGGAHQNGVNLYLVGWSVAVTSDGREGVGGSGRLPLPPIIARRLLAGEELGPVMDDLLGEANVKQKGGAIGALTAGLIPRPQALAVAVAYALAPFVAPDFYN
jgi:inosine/xanthosine triphosphatase